MGLRKLSLTVMSLGFASLVNAEAIVFANNRQEAVDVFFTSPGFSFHDQKVKFAFSLKPQEEKIANVDSTSVSSWELDVIPRQAVDESKKDLMEPLSYTLTPRLFMIEDLDKNLPLSNYLTTTLLSNYLTTTSLNNYTCGSSVGSYEPQSLRGATQKREEVKAIKVDAANNKRHTKDFYTTTSFKLSFEPTGELKIAYLKPAVLKSKPLPVYKSMTKKRGGYARSINSSATVFELQAVGAQYIQNTRSVSSCNSSLVPSIKRSLVLAKTINSEHFDDLKTKIIWLLTSRILSAYPETDVMRCGAVTYLPDYLDLKIYGKGYVGVVNEIELPLYLAMAMLALADTDFQQSDCVSCGTVDALGNIGAINSPFERVLGAQRAGIENIILPEENRSEIEQQGVVEGVTIYYVNTVDEAAAIALGYVGCDDLIDASPMNKTNQVV